MTIRLQSRNRWVGAGDPIASETTLVLARLTHPT